MAAYHVALVRFEGRGKTYPVNGCESFQPGDGVVVRLGWENGQQLAKAVVVGRSFSKKPCRHSIACSEDRAEDYGTGPSGVQTRADLDRYMRHIRQEPVELFSCDHDGRLLDNQDWSLTYVSKFQPPNSLPFADDQNWVTLFRDLYVMGPAGIGVCRTWNGTQMLRASGRKMGVTARGATVIDPSQDGLYRRFAERIEGSLVHKVDRPMEDTSLDQIRSAVGGDQDGPVYLSDGVWL